MKLPGLESLDRIAAADKPLKRKKNNEKWFLAGIISEAMDLALLP